MNRIIFASSSGGHLTELLKLQALFRKYDYLLVTEDTKLTQSLKENYKMEYMKYGSREYSFEYIFVFVYNFIKSIALMIKFKPKIVVSTGAHTGGIMCFVAKLFFKKVIYIESMAKVETLSMTGKLMYLMADKFYVQWEELTEIYPRAEYIGRLI